MVRQRAVWLFLLALGSIAAVIHLSADGPAVSTATWGGALLAGGLAIAFFGERRFDLFSPLFFVGGATALYFGVNALLLASMPPGFFADTTERAAPWFPAAGAISYGCLLGFFAGYEFTYAARAGQRTTLLCWRPSETGLRLLWTIFFLASIGVWFTLLRYDAFLQVSDKLLPSRLQSLISILIIAPFVMSGLASEAAFSGRGAFWWVALAAGLGASLIFGIATGSKGAALLPLAPVLLAWNYRGRLFSRKAAIALLGLFLAIAAVYFPLNLFHREMLVETGRGEQSIGSSYISLARAIESIDEQDPRFVLELTGRSLANRFAHLPVTANILRHQAMGGELRKGATYGLFFASFVPRFFWPDKPYINFSRRFAVELDYGEPETFEKGQPMSITSVGITYIGELVYNFPAPLAPIGMVVIGLIFRWLYETFRTGLQVSPVVAVGVYGYWWYGLLAAGHEGSLAAPLSGVLKATFVLIMLFMIAGFQKSPGPASAGARERQSAGGLRPS